MILAGRYRLERRISRTEMAEVHEAVDQTLERRVAVKVLLPELAEDPDFVARFQREARAAAILNHPNIVSVYDSGESAGQYFIVMEYIDGPTLAELIADDAPLPETRAAEIGMEIAAALGAAHQQGIVHRDMKPGNVLLGGGGIVKIVDFGIARAVAGNTDLTRPGTILGSVSYVSPEQAMGETVGPASDIYSLGAVLYAMVSGRPPFSADTPVAVASQHVHQTPKPPSEINPDVSPALETVILRALAKDPTDRPPSAEAMRQELLDVVEGATAPETTSPDATSVMAATRPATAPSSTQVFTRPPVVDMAPRNRAALTAVVAVGLAIAAIVLIAFLANAVRSKSPTTTTVPTTIPTTTTIRRTTTRPPTTLAPTTIPPTTEPPPETLPTVFPEPTTIGP